MAHEAPQQGEARIGEAPQSVAELLSRAEAIAGRTLGEVAERVGMPAPETLRRAKGFAGQVIERWLGGTAANRSVPDFELLGIELKTIPVGDDGKPVETTYVCTLSVDDLDTDWATSRVRHKLARVLWVPVQGERRIPPAQRRIGAPLLWSPSASEEALLRGDWEEHLALARLGRVDRISARHGVVLQVRPKASSAAQRGWGIDEDGVPERVAPRGFYLRTTFTAAILARHFVL